MSLNDTIEAGVHKKVALFDEDQPRFGVRSILAGVYLALGTAFAAVVGNVVEPFVPGLGAQIFAACLVWDCLPSWCSMRNLPQGR